MEVESMDVSTNDLNEKNFNESNLKEMDAIVADFEKKAYEDGHGETRTDDKTENKNGEGQGSHDNDDPIEGLSLSDILSLLPPEYVSSLLSPSLSIYKISLSKNIDQDTYSEIESLLKSNGRFDEIKKKAISKYLDKYPALKNYEVNPMLTFLVVDLVQTSLIAKNVNGYLTQKGYLMGGEHHGKKEEFKEN